MNDRFEQVAGYACLLCGAHARARSFVRFVKAPLVSSPPAAAAAAAAAIRTHHYLIMVFAECRMGTELIGPILWSIVRAIRPRSILEVGTGFTVTTSLVPVQNQFGTADDLPACTSKHARTHARTLARPHARPHAHAHARTIARTHACSHARSLAQLHVHTRSRTHACKQSPFLIQGLKDTVDSIPSDLQTLQEEARICAHMWAHLHACMRANLTHGYSGRLRSVQIGS